MKQSVLSAALLIALGASTTVSAQTAANHVVELCAGAHDKTVLTSPNTPPIPMWGYALGGVDATTGKCVNTPTSPGPRIIVPPGTAGLEIVLHNTLPRATSLVIPGTVKPMSPVLFTPAGETRQRVRSFDIEAPAGGQATYVWPDLKPGSYMYQSGTHQQVQVQMGLYGAVTKDAATGEAYPGKTYANDIVLFYSEIDRVIHENVQNGMYTEVDMKSTIDYAPKYFLVDVDTGTGSITYQFNDLPSIEMAYNITNPLLRIYNAGLTTHVPTLFGAEFEVIAEDGKPYPSSRREYSLLMPPLKVRDAYLDVTGGAVQILGGLPAPGIGRVFRLTDSAMDVSNPDPTAVGPVVALAGPNEIANGNNNGAVLQFVIKPAPGFVEPTPTGTEPQAKNDSVTVMEGGSLNNILALAQANDLNAAGTTVSILSYPKFGQLVDNGNGDLRYQHDGSEAPYDSLVYELTNASGVKSSAGIKIQVTPVNDPPVAVNDTVSVRVGQTVEIRALANDSDVDSPSIRITGVGASALGTATAMDQLELFEALKEGTETLSYTIADSAGAIASANIDITVSPAQNAGASIYGQGNGGGGAAGSGVAGKKPTTAPDEYTVTEGGVLDITGNPILGVLANDSPGAKVYRGLVEYPENGSIEIYEDGTFIYTHNGDEEEDDHFTYEAYNDVGSTIGEVTIHVVSKMDPPKVNNDEAKTRVDQAVLIDILENDEDEDSKLDPAGILITKQPKHGTVEVDASGRVRYTPAPGYSGKDSFKYRLKDALNGELSKREAKVKIKVK